jgi:hypothetical protein
VSVAKKKSYAAWETEVALKSLEQFTTSKHKNKDFIHFCC